MSPRHSSAEEQEPGCDSSAAGLLDWFVRVLTSGSHARRSHTTLRPQDPPSATGLERPLAALISPARQRTRGRGLMEMRIVVPDAEARPCLPIS